MEPVPDLDSVLGPRDVVVVAGPDAARYLHSQVSQHVESMVDGEQRWTFVLDPTGKIEVLARITRVDGERFELDTDAGYGSALVARLQRFKIRVAADIELLAGDPEAPGGDEGARVRLGWPRMGAEITPGETIPAGTGLTRIAVDLTKGCYPGQELVERMDSRAATAPRSLRRFTAMSGTSAGDPIVVDGDDVGIVTSVAGTDALGWVKRGADVGEVVQF